MRRRLRRKYRQIEFVISGGCWVCLNRRDQHRAGVLSWEPIHKQWVASIESAGIWSAAKLDDLAHFLRQINAEGVPV